MVLSKLFEISNLPVAICPLIAGYLTELSDSVDSAFITKVCLATSGCCAEKYTWHLEPGTVVCVLLLFFFLPPFPMCLLLGHKARQTLVVFTIAFAVKLISQAVTN